MSIPLWIELALADWDVAEVAGSGNNPIIQQYFTDTVGSPLPDSTSWCAAYAGSRLKAAGLAIPPWVNPTNNAATPVAYQSYGTALSGPVVGAVCVKKDSAHVGFVLAVSKDDPNYFAMLSGNTSRTDDDSTDGGVVTVIRRHKSYWNFRMPPT